MLGLIPIGRLPSRNGLCVGQPVPFVAKHQGCVAPVWVICSVLRQQGDRADFVSKRGRWCRALLSGAPTKRPVPF